MPRLADFIYDNIDAITKDWEALSRARNPGAEGLSKLALIDHVKDILQEIAADLCIPQSAADRPAGESGSAAETHAILRAAQGFTIEQVATEYYALRSCVLRLWSKSLTSVSEVDLIDSTRFNDAMDRELTACLGRFSNELARSRDLFLAILSHDLRNPLGAILSTATVLTRYDKLKPSEIPILAYRIRASAKRMGELITDLLDLTRTRLGTTIPISPAPMDMLDVCQKIIDEMRMVNPRVPIQLEANGDSRGVWDRARIEQLITNLVVNAVEHGSTRTPVELRLQDDRDALLLSVHNYGPPVKPEFMTDLANPLSTAGTAGLQAKPATRIKLGLYIAREIAISHGGSLKADSSRGDGTTFSIRLPRTPPDYDQSAA